MSIRAASRQAFTLIELLVVMSIISLLMALLLPSLSKSLESARSIKCGVNLRGIGYGYNCYLTDFKGFAPNFDDSLDANGVAGLDSKLTTFGALGDPVKSGLNILYNLYLSGDKISTNYFNNEALICPTPLTGRDSNHQIQYPTRISASYYGIFADRQTAAGTINAQLGKASSPSNWGWYSSSDPDPTFRVWSGVRPETFKSTRNRVISMDAGQYQYIGTTGQRSGNFYSHIQKLRRGNWCGTANRHSGFSANMVFLDGSVGNAPTVEIAEPTRAENNSSLPWKYLDNANR